MRHVVAGFGWRLAEVEGRIGSSDLEREAMTVKIQDVSKPAGVGCACLLAASLLSGCMGAPTYGTGKPADEQLLEDVTSMLSLGPKNEEQIAYTPRPELVTPTSRDVLPPPQETVASASNPNWPESPEQRRARVRAETTANRDDPDFEPLIENDIAPQQARSQPQNHRWEDVASSPNVDQRTEYKRRVALSKQGSPTERRFLSEPPIAYRQPAATAAVDDIGEDEWKKDKRLKAEARKKAGTTSWRDRVPWL